MRTLAILLCLLAAAGCVKKTESSEDTAGADPRPDSVFIKDGNRLVALSFDTLRQSLLAAIGTYGVEGAISFCHEQAMPLTSAYADSVIIRRTALRYRSPGNKPDSLEVLTLSGMEEQMKEGETPAVKLVRDHATGDVHFFKPILMQAMCLNCHGEPGKELSNATRERIREFYPKDAAVNFKEGDLRGVWHVVFNSRRE